MYVGSIAGRAHITLRAVPDVPNSAYLPFA
jgi:hypothetical protein